MPVKNDLVVKYIQLQISTQKRQNNGYKYQPSDFQAEICNILLFYEDVI